MGRGITLELMSGLLSIFAGSHMSLAAAEQTGAGGSSFGVPRSAASLSTSGVLSTPLPTGVPSATGECLVSILAGAVPSQVDGGAVLADGDLLVGLPISLQAGVLTIATGAFGTLQIADPQLAGVVISAVPTAAPLDIPAAFSGAVLTNGERISGQPSFLNQLEAGIDTGKRVVQIPRARLAALVLRAPVAPAKPVVRLRLATGDLVSGVVSASTGGWSLRHALGEWTIPLSAVRGWSSAGPDRMSASAMRPSATYTDQLDPPLIPLLSDRELDGGWLHVGALRCDCGLALRAGTTASITLPPGSAWKSLVALVGVDHGGPAVVTVKADDRVVYTSPELSMQTAPTAIAVPAGGAKVLTLSVVNSHADDQPAAMVCGWPTLIR